MNKDERGVLWKIANDNGGLISPATAINSYASGRRGLIEKLVTLGYIEMVPEEIQTGTIINFYRVTERGFSIFYPFYKKIWYASKGGIRTVVVSGMTSALTTFITFSIYWILQKA